jgi:carbon monoxide dehydrogenase subunit G
MRITGQNSVAAPVQQVWDAVLDPGVLVATIPGCVRLQETGPHTYAMTVSAGVAAIKGTYDGTCALSDLVEPSSLTMRVEGAGAPGTIGATVGVSFLAEDDGTTTLSYDADAVVGGMIGGVGQRMLASVSKRMAGEFFGNLEKLITQGAPAARPVGGTAAIPVPVGSGAGGAVFSPSPSTPSRGGGLDQQSFLTGVGVGAGLLLVGVLVGSRLRR